MKKSIKEKYTKMYLVMLCGLLVSGAIVCSTNGNGDANGNGNGNGNGDPLMFACPNGTAVTSTADNMPTAAGVENCAECDTNFTQTAVPGSSRMTCEPDSGFAFVCEDGTPASGISATADVENCDSCNSGFGEVTQGGLTTCQPEYVCTNGTKVTATRPSIAMAGVENCDSCNSGFGEVTQGGLTTCQPEYVCTNGTAVTATRPSVADAGSQNCTDCATSFTKTAVSGSDPERMTCEPDSGFAFVCEDGIPASGTSSTANVENCDRCTTASFMLEASGSEMVCRAPYVCPKGTIQSGTTTMADVENCASCTTTGFIRVAAVSGTEMVCRAPYMCPNGTAVGGGSATMADVENCASCNTAAGFSLEASGSEMVCRTPYVCTNGTVVDDTTTTAGVENCASCSDDFDLTAGGGGMICQPEYVCTNGTAESGTTTMSNVENCAECDAGFGEETQSGRTTCNALPIALWNAGEHDGDFGFALCQTRLDDTNDTIGSELTTLGYTKAVFFGSTGTGDGGYLFIDIGSDADALALPAVGGGSPGSVSDRNIVVFTVSSGTVSVTNTFGAPAMARTLDNVTNVGAGGVWQNGGADVISAAGISDTSTRAWSFTLDRALGSHCKSATSVDSDDIGYRMNSTAVDSNAVLNMGNTTRCNRQRFVLCVAR